MQVHRQINNLPKFNQAVITVGSFDGVHAGHRQIINRIIKKANNINGQSVIITFNPHPRIVLDPKGHSITLLNSLEEKIQLLEELGVDHLVVVPFDLSFSQLTPQKYIEDFLLSTFSPAVIIIGYDHKFGHDRSGDIDMLKKYQALHNFDLIEIEQYLVKDAAVSSTKIRKALRSNNIETANNLLSYPYILSGVVTRGDQIGRTIGYPTANLTIDEPFKLIPPDGIYAVTCRHKNTEYNGMLYIGSRPTVNDMEQQVIEVNIFDFNQEIYDDSLQIQLLKYIRPDASLDSMEALKSQIDQDRTDVQSFFKISLGEKKKNCVVAVLNYNGAQLLEKYIPILIKHSPQADIVIIDNKSSDKSIEYLKTLNDQIQIIELDKNYGFAEGYNIGINKLSNYRYTLLLNSDVRVSKNWLTPLLDVMDNDNSIAAVQPKIKSEENPEYFEYAGASGGYISSWGFPFCRGRFFDSVEIDQGQYDDPVHIHWCSGAAMLVRTKLYIESGGLDKDYFAHQEEIDLCWRFRNAGYKLMVIPMSAVYHVGGGTLSYSSPKKLYLNYRNNLTTIIKNAPRSQLIWLLPWRIALDKIAALRLLLSGDFQGFRSIISALTFNIFHAFNLISRRKKTKKITLNLKSKNKNLYQSRRITSNIIIPYFIKGKKKFSDLNL